MFRKKELPNSYFVSYTVTVNNNCSLKGRIPSAFIVFSQKTGEGKYEIKKLVRFMPNKKMACCVNTKSYMGKDLQGYVYATSKKEDILKYNDKKLLSKTYEINEKEYEKYDKLYTGTYNLCNRPPDFNLYSNNCHQFSLKTLRELKIFDYHLFKNDTPVQSNLTSISFESSNKNKSVFIKNITLTNNQFSMFSSTTLASYKKIVEKENNGVDKAISILRDYSKKAHWYYFHARRNNAPLADELINMLQNKKESGEINNLKDVMEFLDHEVNVRSKIKASGSLVRRIEFIRTLSNEEMICNTVNQKEIKEKLCDFKKLFKINSTLQELFRESVDFDRLHHISENPNIKSITFTNSELEEILILTQDCINYCNGNKDSELTLVKNKLNEINHLFSDYLEETQQSYRPRKAGSLPVGSSLKGCQG